MATKAIKRPLPVPEGSYAGLAAAQRVGARREERPKGLPLKALSIVPAVFQWRDIEGNGGIDVEHVQELVRVLRDTNAQLDPILVSAIGSRFFVIDGHHRLAAYYTAEWKQTVPVEYFEGSLDEAQEESLRRNSKNKLPMTQQDKLEAAWKMVCQEHRTKKSIAECTTISPRTVSTMRKVLREHPEAKGEPWRRARHLQWGSLNEIPDDWLEQRAEKLAKQWAKNMPRDFHKHPDVVARALALLSPDLPRDLVCQWSDLAEEFFTYLEREAEFKP